MKTIPGNILPEILPHYFFTVPREYALVSLEEPDTAQTEFIYCLNSPIAAKRCGRIVSYAIAHGMTIAAFEKISNDLLIELVTLCRPEYKSIMLPSSGILRLRTSPTMEKFWHEVTHNKPHNQQA